jgi:hypothetical protein
MQRDALDARYAAVAGHLHGATGCHREQIDVGIGTLSAAGNGAMQKHGEHAAAGCHGRRSR